MTDERTYATVQDAARRLGVSERTVRNLCEEYEWFGGKLGTSATWVLTEPEIAKMQVTPRKGPGRPPRNPVVGTAET